MTKLTNEELNKIREIKIHTILGIPFTGRRVSIRCPLQTHRDRTPSFTLYPKNNYYCFSCQATGNGAIDFVIALGFSFQEACLELIKYV